MKNLPPFTIRESPRARRVILKVSARHGIEVVIPLGFSRTRVPEILWQKKTWLEQAFRKMQARERLPDPPRDLPDGVFFEAVSLGFAVEYVPTDSPFLKLVYPDQSSLRIIGDISNLQGCQELLKRWLQQQGRLHLIPRLLQLSAETGLCCQKVQIRRQKTLWGSCSQQGTISLNQNLLFLRPPLVRYLIIHELCHTVHLNHSDSFYQLKGHFIPDYKELRAELKQVRDHLPWWAL